MLKKVFYFHFVMGPKARYWLGKEEILRGLSPKIHLINIYEACPANLALCQVLETHFEGNDCSWTFQ